MALSLGTLAAFVNVTGDQAAKKDMDGVSQGIHRMKNGFNKFQETLGKTQEKVSLLTGVLAAANIDMNGIRKSITGNNEELKQAESTAGQLLQGASGIAGSFAGATFGAKVGAFAGPIGAAIGTAVGATAGFLFGEVIGEKLGQFGDEISDRLFRERGSFTDKEMAAVLTKQDEQKLIKVKQRELEDLAGPGATVRTFEGDGIGSTLGNALSETISFVTRIPTDQDREDARMLLENTPRAVREVRKRNLEPEIRQQKAVFRELNNFFGGY